MGHNYVQYTALLYLCPPPSSPFPPPPPQQHDCWEPYTYNMAFASYNVCAICSIDIGECTRSTHNCSSLNQVCQHSVHKWITMDLVYSGVARGRALEAQAPPPPLSTTLYIHAIDCRRHHRNSPATLHGALLCLHCSLVDVQVHGQHKWVWSTL